MADGIKYSIVPWLTEYYDYKTTFDEEELRLYKSIIDGVLLLYKPWLTEY